MSKKIPLPNNCACSQLSVFPRNWETVRADPKILWRIHYRFYQPGKKPKLVIIKGMNDFNDVYIKRKTVKALLESELSELKAGYNPNLKEKIEQESEMLFLNALQAALSRLRAEPHTKEDIASMLRYAGEAANKLGLNNLPISQVRRKHLRMVLDKCTENKTANTFNHYRKYLSILFTELLELEAVEFNPIRDIARRKTVKKIRQTLSVEERTLVNDYLFNNYYNFWRFLQIFFHSGARIIELMKLKRNDVELNNQRYKVTIRKGRSVSEKWKVITDEALSLWIEHLQHAGEPYIFSKGLLPGPGKIRTEQVTRRWKRLVKDKLGITADMYSNKHLKATLISDQLGQEAAAKLASHSSTKMVAEIYDINSKVRQDKILRNVKTPF